MANTTLTRPIPTNLDKTTVIVMRHGKKKDDSLTAHGRVQVLVAARALRATGLRLTAIVHSGKERAKQTAEIVAGVFEVDPHTIREIKGFDPENLFPAAHRTANYMPAVMAEHKLIRDAGGMVSDALPKSSYAREARKQISQAIIETAKRIGPSRALLAVSHSPFAELACVDLFSMPYGLGEADAVEYKVMNGRIVSSTLIKGPMGGESNTSV